MTAGTLQTQLNAKISSVLESSPEFADAVSKSGLSVKDFVIQNQLTPAELKSKYNLGFQNVMDLNSAGASYNPNTFDTDWYLSHLKGSAATAANQIFSGNFWYNPTTGQDEPVSKTAVAAYLKTYYDNGSPINAVQSGDVKYDSNNIYNAAVSAISSPSGTSLNRFQDLLNSNKWTAAELQKQGFTQADFGSLQSNFNAFPYSTSSPFASAAAGSASVPSVEAYSASNPSQWGRLYSDIQSGNLRLTTAGIEDPNNPGATVAGLRLAGPSGTLGEDVNKVGDNLYSVTSREGDYTNQFYVRVDPYSGYVEPISNPKQIQSSRSNYTNTSFLGGLVAGTSNLIQELGPMALTALSFSTGGLGSYLAETLGVSPAVGSAIASAGTQVAQGVPLDKALQSAATSFIGANVGSAVNTMADEAAVAANYGTDLGSQQTAMLAAQEAGLGSATDTVGNIAGKITGSTVAGTLAGKDLETAATQGLINAGISTGASALAGLGSTGTSGQEDIFTDTTAAEVPATDTEFSQETDVTGEPIGGTRIPLENGGFQTNNPDGSVTYEDPDGSVYKVNPDGTYTTESIGQTNTYNPATGEFTQPTSTATTTTTPTGTTSDGLSQQQIESLLKTGAGLLTGAAGATALAKALGGSSSGSTTSTATPTTGTQAGTYSGLNPYNAAYFQQVQQNYNRLFPTAPADVATPLQSWYATQYVPDTSISKKLFGV